MGFFKCLCYLAGIGIGSFLLGRLLPKSWFHAERFPYRSFSWEHGGSLYNAIGIRKWQNRVPDMSRIFPHMMQEKKVGMNFKKNLPLMIQETCIAEFVHALLCLASVGCLRCWPGPGGLVMTILDFLGNIPFILIQRFNRPRLCALLERTSRKACERSSI